MFCPNCGTANPSQTGFCTHCGASMPGPIQAPSQVPSGQVLQQAPGANPAPRVENNMVMAIVTTVFTFLCCNLLALPFAIVAIVKASAVNDKALRGDLAGAQADAEGAKKFSMIALVVWLVTTVLWFILNFMLGFGHAMWSR